MRAIVELRDRDARCSSSRSTPATRSRSPTSIAYMELGRIVWCGPRADADVHLLAASYLGGSTGTEIPG